MKLPKWRLRLITRISLVNRKKIDSFLEISVLSETMEIDMNEEESSQALAEQKEKFISTWGAMGSSWGINRTLAQIHALLLITPDPLTTEDIMDQLAISRGNANTNLRELVKWGLARVIAIRGERKDYFEAEKDVWKIFCAVTRGRKQQEIDPALTMLKETSAASNGETSHEGKEFHRITTELAQFVGIAGSLMDRVARSEKNRVLPVLMKLIPK